MAASRTAKGTVVSKSSSTTLTLPNVSMIGGDKLIALVAWDITESSNPTVKYANKELDNDQGETMTAKWRMRMVSTIVNNTREADLVATFPSACTAKVMIVVSLHQAGLVNIKQSNENAAATLSTTGTADDPDHINSIHLAFHLSNDPAGATIGSSSTGHTLGQRAGTTGDADNTNIVVQEVYKILTASIINAGSFILTKRYQIKTLGTTDFTAIGAASNTVGLHFTATGIGTGTGDAYYLDDTRSRISGLDLADHMAVAGFYRPKRTYTIKDMVQYNRNVNQNPDWVMAEIEDDNGRGFWMRIDPDLFDDWSDAVIDEYVAKFCSVWETNIYDDNLVYEADTVRNARIATFVDKEIIL